MGHSRVAPRLAFTLVLALAAFALVPDAGADGSGAKTSITVWATPAPPLGAYGGYPALYGGISYGGFTSPSGAMITERRDVDVTSDGEVRIAGIASTVDPATVQLRSLTDPTGLGVREQRFVPGASTPDEILARHVGDQVTIVTAKGEVAGILRSADTQALVLEVGSGAQKRIQVMRRDGYVQDIRMPAGPGIDQPSLVWRLATKKPGKHTVEVTYRADGLTWGADYLAIYDEAARTIDFSAWATLRNATGTSFDGAELTLVSGRSPSPLVVNPYTYGAQALQPRPSSPGTRYTVPTPVHVGNGESVQVELMPPRRAAKARSVITFEAMTDMSASYQAYPASDCTMLSASVPGNSHADVAVEIDVPNAKQLPDGKVRVFRRPAKAPERLEVLNEEPLRASAGVARIRLASHTELTGERRATACNIDERAHTITEKIEVKLENKAKSAAAVVVREFLWRYPIWKIDPADESIKGKKAGAQTQEYRVSVPAGGKKSLTYTVVYTYQ